jgi:hypothetical protein
VHRLSTKTTRFLYGADCRRGASWRPGGTPGKPFSDHGCPARARPAACRNPRSRDQAGGGVSGFAGPSDALGGREMAPSAALAGGGPSTPVA